MGGYRTARGGWEAAVKLDSTPAAGARPHLAAQRRQRLARKEEADARHEAVAHGVAQILAELPGGALGGLQGDVAGKPPGDKDIDGAPAAIAALDETVVAHVGQIGLAQNPARCFDPLDPPDFLNP